MQLIVANPTKKRRKRRSASKKKSAPRRKRRSTSRVKRAVRKAATMARRKRSSSTTRRRRSTSRRGFMSTDLLTTGAGVVGGFFLSDLAIDNAPAMQTPVGEIVSKLAIAYAARKVLKGKWRAIGNGIAIGAVASAIADGVEIVSGNNPLDGYLEQDYSVSQLQPSISGYLEGDAGLGCYGQQPLHEYAH